MRNYREQSEQIAVADWLRWSLIPPAFFVYFPAGEGRLSMAHAIKLKRKGLRAGMPDLWLFDVGRVFAIEMKVPKSGRLSDPQKEAHPMLRAVGIEVAVCTTLDAVMTQCREWGLPLRDKPASPVDALARDLAQHRLDARGG